MFYNLHQSLYKPGGDGYFRQITHNGSWIQAYEGRQGFGEKIHLTDENIWRL